MEHISPQTKPDHALMREIYRAYLDELSAILAYTTNAILLAPHFPTVAALLEEIAEDEMRHFTALGRMLYGHGISPTVDTRIRQSPVRKEEKSEAQQAALARGILEEALADEQSAEASYRRLGAWARESEMRRLFNGLAEDERTHAAALSASLARLSRS